MNSIQFADGEKIMSVSRRHWLAFIIEIIFLLLGGALPIALYSFKRVVSSYHFFDFYLQPHVFTLFCLLWFQFLLILLFVALSDHYLDTWIITDSRIIDVEQHGTFSRTVSSLRYESVGEMTAVKGKNLEKLFGFGSLHIKKTDGSGEFVLADIRRPEKIRELILDEQRKNLERLAATMRNAMETVPKENPSSTEDGGTRT